MRAQGVHDVAVVGVSVSLPYGASAVYPGWGHYPEEWRQIRITVVVENQGTEPENFTVTPYYDNCVIQGYVGLWEYPSNQTQAVTNLSPGANATLTFTWDTWGVPPCKYNFTGKYYVPYTVSANASVVPGEVDTADNTLVNGTVTVRLSGDANGDGMVTGGDLAILGRKWYMIYPQPEYDWRADFNGDGRVTGTDLAILGRNWYKLAEPA